MTKSTDIIKINLTDEQGALLGQMTITADELRSARKSPMGAQALADTLAGEAGCW